jgi:hypothetical protein
MEIKEKVPEDFFKRIQTCLKSFLKYPDINLPKITNAIIKYNIQNKYKSYFVY